MLRPKEFWPGGRVSHFRGHTSTRLCRTPAKDGAQRPLADGRCGRLTGESHLARAFQAAHPKGMVSGLLRASPCKPCASCIEGALLSPFSRRWCSNLISGKGSWLLFPRWAANIPPISGPRGHQRVMRAVANSVCLGTRDPAWSPSPDLSSSLLLARRAALLDFLKAGCPYLPIFLIFCGLVGDLVVTPGSATSCCLFPRYNLPASLSSLKRNTWCICVWYFLLFLQLKFYPFMECPKFCGDAWPEYSFHCWKPILL